MAGDAGVGDPSVTMTEDATVGSDVGAACTAPKVDGCNPVKNEGCVTELGMQCGIDFLAFTLAGSCTFSAPSDPPDAGGCLNTIVTESCLPKHSCIEGQCRKLCFCDSDCGQGEVCVDKIGDKGFKACGKR
jgi:hypothetical protein